MFLMYFHIAHFHRGLHKLFILSTILNLIWLFVSRALVTQCVTIKKGLQLKSSNAFSSKIFPTSHPRIFTDKCLNVYAQRNVGNIILFERRDLWINHLIVPLDKSFLQLMSASATALN